MPEQPSLDEQIEIKKRAIRRVIAAGVLVAAGIAALTVLTHYKSEPPAPRTIPSATVLPAEPAVPPPAEMAAPPTAPQEAEAQPTTPPESEIKPPPPPPPEVVNAQPKTPSASAPMAARPVPAKPVPAAPTVAQQPDKPAILKKAESLSEAPQAKTPTAKPAAAEKPIESTRPTVSQPPAKAAETAAKGFAVQIGVFSNMANAQQLQERLSQNGIKSYTETKLHVGPFQNKAEAEQAMVKIRALGINAVVVPVH